MDKISVRTTSIIVHDYNLGDCLELENNFHIWNPITHRYDTLGMYYDKDTKNLYLPRGIDIWKVKNYFGEKYNSVENPNSYMHISNILMRFGPRDEEQKEALRFMCGVNEYSDNAYLPQLSVNLNTGKGKTYCSIATIAYMKMKSIVITGSNTLLSQWKNNVEEYTNLSDQDVLFISGSDMMNMIASGESKLAKNAKIFFLTHGTIRSFCDTYGWNKLNSVFNTLGIGIKIIDEAHTNFANTLMLDFYTNVYKTYYVTATPARSDWRENRIYQLFIKNVPSINLFNEDRDPHTDYIAIKWNSRPNAMQISECRNAYGLDRNKYIDYVTNQPNFYMMMRIIMDMVIKCKGRVLFYIGTNDAILKVYKWMGENYPEFIGDIGIYTSLISKELKMKEKEKKLLLSTTKSAGIGEDIANLKMTIVLAEPFKSEVLSRQTLGRTRNKDTMYIELVDMGFKSIRNFYYYKLPIFNKYALSTSDTSIEQYELQQRSYAIEDKRKEKNWMNPIYFRDERFFDYTERDIRDNMGRPKDKIISPLIFYINKNDE